MCVIVTVEAKVCSSSVSVVYIVTFVHGIFKGTPSKKGFHGTHETSSGSGTGRRACPRIVCTWFALKYCQTISNLLPTGPFLEVVVS